MLLPFERTKRSILVRKESKTSGMFGCNPESRPTEVLLNYGIINVNKPQGPTSHQVSAYVQNILGIQKSGHSGTLDPNVTGVLPVALGRATRIVQVLLTAGKEYVALMHLHREVKEKKLKKAFEQFTGTINQLPPVRSAVKRQIRARQVYYIELMDTDGQDILIRTGTQAGTYIRKLIHDIGQKLGTGAHMSGLIRTKAGPFNDSEMYTLQDIADAYHYHKEGDDKLLRKVIKPMEYAVGHMPKVWVLDSTVESLCHGFTLAVPGISKVESGINPDDIVAVMTLKDELICLGKARTYSDEMVLDKGIAVRTEKVFMLPGTYPKLC